MTLKELIDKADVVKVLTQLIKDYEDQEKLKCAYADMLFKLKEMKPKINSDNKPVIITAMPVEDFLEEGEFSTDVFGYCKENGEHYAMEFTPWAEWLASEVNEKSIEYYGEESFLAHCLYEMSFISFEEEDIKKEMDTLVEIDNELKSGTAKTYTMDEVFAEFGFEKPAEKTEEEKKETIDKMNRIKVRNEALCKQFDV